MGQFPKFCNQAVHDDRGKLLFFIIDNNFYNEYGDGIVDPGSGNPLFLHDENALNTVNEIHRFQVDYLIVPEVTIVPKPVLEPDPECAMEFYIFYAIKYFNGSGFNYIHYVKTLAYYSATNIQVVDSKSILSDFIPYNQSASSLWQPSELSMGISPYNEIEEEYIYVIKGDQYFFMYQIQDNMSEIKLENAIVTFYNLGSTPAFTEYFPELEICKDNIVHTFTLAFAHGYFNNNGFTNAGFGFWEIPMQYSSMPGIPYGTGANINTPGSPPNPYWVNLYYLSFPSYTYDGTTYDTGTRYVGLEFSSNSEYLYLTKEGLPGYAIFDMATEYLYLSSLGNYDFGNSYIERGKDNDLYLAKTTSIPTGTSFNSVIGEIYKIVNHDIPVLPANFIWAEPYLDDDQLIATGSLASGHYAAQSISADFNYFVFPDQVDDFEFSDYYNTVGMHLVFDEFPSSLNPIEIWSSGCGNNNPWNSADGHVYLTGDAVIPEGKEVKLVGMTLHFDVGKSLTLMSGTAPQDGAYLELDECTLTSGSHCGVNDYWTGVKLYGDYSSPQSQLLSNNQQPVFKSYNESKIENATIGIHSHGGGIIKSTGTDYYNNKSSIRFEIFQNTATSQAINVGNISAFDDCTFNVDDNMFGYISSQYKLESHVLLNDVDGIYFKECVFDNEQNSLQFSPNYDIGIQANNSGFKVTGDCSIQLQPGEACPDQFNSPCVFRNLNQGVCIDGGSKLVKINESTFEDNITGIDMRSTEDVIIIRNDFKIGGNTILNAPANKHFGIYSEGSTAYQIEENEFDLSQIPIPSIYSYGIVINESLEAYNEIYNNEFNDIFCAINPLNKNRQNSLSFIGLQILCNDFNNLQGYDININQDNTSPQNGIALKQGLEVNDASAGNWFTPNIATIDGNYSNNTTFANTYHFSGSAISTNPEFPANRSTVVLSPQSLPNSCPSNLSGIGTGPFTPGVLAAKTSGYYTARTEYYNLLYNYNQQIDDGNTPALLVEIQSTWPQEAWDLRNDLMAISPFVSRDAIQEAAFSGILSDALLLEVCLANPDATRDEELVRQLEFDIPNTLPSYMIDMIRSSWSGVTSRTILEKGITTHGCEMNSLFNTVVKDIKSRTAYATSELTNWYLERANLVDYYSIADIYVEDKSFAAALNTLNEVAVIFNLDEIQQEEHNNFVAYLAFMIELHNNGKTIYDIDGVDILALTNMAAIHGGMAAQNARNILCLSAGICEPCYGITDAPDKSSRSVNLSTDVPELSTVSVNPNPAKDFTVLEWEFFNLDDEIQINILNSTGQIMETFHSASSIGAKQIATSDYEDGIYFYEFVTKDTKLASGKLIISK